MSRPVDQPSAAKPRDLRQDLAIAAQQTTKKRKVDGGENQEKQYLANKGSKIQELEAELKLSQAETAHLSQQLEQAKSTTQTDAERLATIQGERDFLNSQRSRERLDTEKQLSQAEQKILSLRKDLRHTEDAKTQAEEQAHLSMSEANSTKSQAANAAATHRRQLQQLQNDLQLAQHDAQQAEQQSTSHIRRQQNRIEAMNQQLELLQQQLRDVSEEAELHNQQRMQAEEKVAALQLQGDSASAAPSDDSILLQNLRDELAAQCADVAEARRLKYHVRNTEVLQEQLHAAQLRAEAAEKQVTQAEQLSLQLAELQSRQEVWDKVLQGLSGAETPENVLILLESLQTQILKSTELLGQKENQLAKQAGELQQTLKELSENKAALIAQASMCEQLSTSQSRLERRVELLTKERDSLKQILTLYQEEDPKPAVADGTPQRAARAAHVAQLEDTMADLRSQYEAGQQELASREIAAQNSLSQLTAAKQQAAEATGLLKTLQKVYEDQSKELALLQERLGKGEFDRSKTRVIHFKHNPEAEAVEKAQQSKCSTLQAENTALKGQLQKLEGHSAAAAAGSIDVAVQEAQITVLQHKVADLEKAKTRLSQVFKAQIAGFREACYQMFGYQVDVVAEAAAVKAGKAAAVSLYTLTPQHADDANAKLQFRMNREGKMQLVTSHYVQNRLSKEVETFIDRFNSIAAFTANYTMEQFQKQTQC
ncbi:MAG: hypothetical protein FRX49_04584 [Trebouxia sp. A1-2]|nr:MAG: hypothetical protein FRX49_04584 [Trebouxia sp. A1-2]